MLITFSFAYDPEKQTGTFAGNIDPLSALTILQSLIYSNIQGKIEVADKKEKSHEAT